MLNTFLVFVAVAGCIWFCWSAMRKMLQRIQTLEQELRRASDAVSQLAEIQMQSHKKSSGRLEEMEERIMELSIPSHDSNLPLERRHQVLALSRQGVPLEDIVKRLKAPVGEAELILNLSKYTGGEGYSAGKMQVKQYV